MSQGWRLCANHQSTERCIGFFTRVANTRHFTATKHCTGCAKLSDFMQFVADVQQAATFTDQLFQDDKKFFNRLRGQHRGGLVQDE